jgi:hypothetical protein
VDKKTGEEGTFYIGDFGTTIIGVDSMNTVLSQAEVVSLFVTKSS